MSRSRVHLLSALLLFGCSNADMCEPGEACVGFAYASYRNVVNSECAEACAQMEQCDETFANNRKGDCEQACRDELAKDYYWNCEPRFRTMLDCVADRNDCRADTCAVEVDAFDSCRTDTLPAYANSCVLANNGVCNEPEECVVGSDTTDCTSARSLLPPD